MTLVGSRPEWVLAMLACWRMGAVALPCNPQLRRKDLELRARAADPKLCVGEARYLGELPDGIPYMDMDDLARVFDEDLDQETPAAIGRPRPRRPGGDRLHLGHDRRAARRRLPAALPGRPASCRPSTGSAPRDGEIAWCTAAPGWSKSTRNAFIAPWLDGRRRGPPRRPLRPRRAAAPLRGARRQRPLPGADRVPDAGQARRAARRCPRLRRMVSAGEPIEPE